MSRNVVRLAVLGDPLRFTLSPSLHQAALDSLDVQGESHAIPTPVDRLEQRLAELAAQGFRGCNLTIPLKEAAVSLVSRVSEESRRARSVNTVGFEPAGTWGATTDGAGFVAWLESLGHDVSRERVVILGAGGAARSVALGLVDRGAGVTASARRAEAVRADWEELGAEVVPWGSPAETERLGECTLVVNATPEEDPNAFASFDAIEPAATVVDLRYGPEPTPWVRLARSRGRRAHDGRGMLAHQARLSLELWLERDVPLEPLLRAVGGAS